MTIVIAHRGAWRRERENTLPAFRRARLLGADWVELDVRSTADGVLAVHHDARLPGGRAIAAMVAASLPAEVPTLADALEACAGMGVHVEIKNDPGEPGYDAGGDLAAAVTDVVQLRAEPVVISSFDLATVDAARRRGAATAWLVAAVDDTVLATLIDRGHRLLHPWDGAVDESVVASCHTLGVGVNVWTVDDPVRMAELAAWGVDGICTNVPDVAVSVLRR